MRKLAWIAILLPCLALVPGHSQKDPKAELPELTWQEKAAKAGLDKAAVDQLARDRLIVTDHVLRQSFSAYLKSDLPLFVTSDAVLNAFHVLLEESMRRWEASNADELRVLLKHIYSQLPEAMAIKVRRKTDAEFAPGLPRARRVIAVALHLLGEKVELQESDAAIVQAEVARIVKAEGRLKPEWLGKPDPGFIAIDYGRFTPVGLYTSSEELKKYFRAVRWLQAVPFRPAFDEEYAAILLLGWTVDINGGGRAIDAERRLERFREWLGTGDDLDLAEASSEGWTADTLKEGRDRLAEAQKSAPAINDQLRLIPQNPDEVAEVSYRILPAAALPDTVLFQRTTDPRRHARPWPTGLEVAAVLGSPVANEVFTGEQSATLREDLAKAKPLFEGSTIYARYLRVLRHLVDTPEADAPSMFGQRPWQTKSCNTLLAGWAQMRHTFVLQAKELQHYLGLSRQPAGFVEPEPEFFSALTSLVDDIRKQLEDRGALALPVKQMAEDLRAYAKLLEDKKPWEDKKAFEKMTPEEIGVYTKGSYLCMALDISPDRRLKEPAAMFAAHIKDAFAVADALERGTFGKPEKLAKAADELGENLAALWKGLSDMCRRLESFAHKQLRGVEFSEEESKYLRGIGEKLAAAMLYAGNSWLVPNDNAPKATVVMSNGTTGRHFHVGVARPRILYVLYPWKGKDVLCRGVVLPYYEFDHDSRLTDAQWLSLLDSDKRPAMPAWLKPIATREFTSPIGRQKPSNDD